jgi:protein TonB
MGHSNPAFCWAGAGFLMSMPDLARFGAALLDGPRAKVGAAELALLLLVLLSLGQMRPAPKTVPMATVSFDTRDFSETPPEPEAKPASDSARSTPRPVPPRPTPEVAQVAPALPPAAIIPVSPQQMRSFDIANLPTRPKAPAGPPIGPAYTPAFGDSKRVGTAPNGQPMYAAAWYREPTDQELSGYLSTAVGPAWGLITCRTVADYRVEDCVGLDEYPEGSHMLRAVLAAAWQFRVRPPRVNGVSQVGDWVRIRIEYEVRPAPAYGGGGTK